MRIPDHFQKVMTLLLICAILVALPGCDSPQKHQSPQEEALGYYWYEAVFLDKEEVEKAFVAASDNYPKYEFVPDNFHVTALYMPEQKHEDLYGAPVNVHIIGYTYGSVQDTEENFTSDNEGFLVEVSSTDEKMQDLIEGIDKTWHITGSYSGAAVYTNQHDFSDCTPLDITIEGVFGLADSDGTVISEPQN